MNKTYNTIPDYNTLQQKIMTENSNALSSKIHIDTLEAIRSNQQQTGYVKLQAEQGYRPDYSAVISKKPILKTDEAKQLQLEGDDEEQEFIIKPKPKVNNEFVKVASAAKKANF